MIPRPAPSEYAQHYAGYVARVPEGDVLDQLASQIAETRALLRDLPPSRAVHRYATGKWSVAEVVGHVADAERIFAYRALRIGRAMPPLDRSTRMPTRPPAASTGAR
jgi:hypothetical protein